MEASNEHEKSFFYIYKQVNTEQSVGVLDESCVSGRVDARPHFCLIQTRLRHSDSSKLPLIRLSFKTEIIYKFK